VNPFKKPVESMGPELVSTFLGRASPEIAMQAFGYLMAKLKLWGKLESSGDVERHNAAMEILAEMRAAPSLGLKNLGKLTFAIEYAKQDEI
jgi:hypothetical protein